MDKKVYRILSSRRAVESPIRALSNNAGVEGAVVVEQVKSRKGNEGYDVAAAEDTDLVKAGMVDLKEVTRMASQTAVSIPALLLTSERLIAETEARRLGSQSSGVPGASNASYQLRPDSLGEIELGIL